MTEPIDTWRTRHQPVTFAVDILGRDDRLNG